MVVAFALLGATGESAKAPQALRLWADAAAEVARAAPPVAGRPARRARAMRVVAPAPSGVPRPLLSAYRPARTDTGARPWPPRQGRRGILALKSSRLI